MKKEGLFLLYLDLLLLSEYITVSWHLLTFKVFYLLFLFLVAKKWRPKSTAGLAVVKHFDLVP